MIKDAEELVAILIEAMNKDRVDIPTLAKETKIRLTEIQKFLLYSKTPRLDQFVKMWNAIETIVKRRTDKDV